MPAIKGDRGVLENVVDDALTAPLFDDGFLAGAVAAERRADPRGDVVSRLATVTLDGDQLDDAELAMFLVQLLVAGNETTRNARWVGDLRPTSRAWTGCAPIRAWCPAPSRRSCAGPAPWPTSCGPPPAT